MKLFPDVKLAGVIATPRFMSAGGVSPAPPQAVSAKSKGAKRKDERTVCMEPPSTIYAERTARLPLETKTPSRANATEGHVKTFARVRGWAQESAPPSARTSVPLM